MDPEGNTYERTAIQGWLKKSKSSPITRSYLESSMLKQNRALKDATESFRQRRAQGVLDTNGPFRRILSGKSTWASALDDTSDTGGDEVGKSFCAIGGSFGSLENEIIVEMAASTPLLSNRANQIRAIPSFTQTPPTSG